MTFREECREEALIFADKVEAVARVMQEHGIRLVSDDGFTIEMGPPPAPKVEPMSAEAIEKLRKQAADDQERLLFASAEGGL